jgi:GrpB-like predicted nucleotidyltransferase (UPF0157 family)
MSADPMSANILAPPDPAWAMEFEALRRVYESALGSLVQRVEHIGSTAVPHLSAKPILDVDIVMRDYGVFPEIVEGLGRLGYRHNGDQGIPHREAFKPVDRMSPHAIPQREWMPHHLYVCPAYSTELHRHIAFRDALRSRSDWRREYQEMKRSIEGRCGGDRKVYASIKELECRDFVERVVAESRMPARLEPELLATTR